MSELRFEVTTEQSSDLFVLLSFERVEVLDNADSGRDTLVFENVHESVAVIIERFSTSVRVQCETLSIG